MPKKLNDFSGRSRPQRSAAGLMLYGLVGLFVAGGFVIVARDILPAAGFSMQARIHGWGVLAILVGGIVTGGVLIYAAVIVWLLLGKLFFTRDQMEAIMKFGRTTRFDRWLLDRCFPQPPAR